MRIKVILYSFFLCVVLSGCHILPYEGKGFGHIDYTNQKPDDEISQAIKDAVGEKVYYQGKDEGTTKRYNYIIKDYDDENLLVEITDAAQNAITNLQEEDNFVTIALWEEVLGDARQLYQFLTIITFLLMMVSNIFK